MSLAISSALLTFVWQGAVLGVLLWVVLFLLRNRSANARYVVCCATLILMAMTPIVTAGMRFQRQATAIDVAKAIDQVLDTRARLAGFPGSADSALSRWFA